MIPTLFGVTVISFLVMQLAPGDPLRAKLGMSGMASQSGQTREAYLVQKRDLHLDKPILLNFNHFRDYSWRIECAAHYLGRDDKEVLAELPSLAAEPDSPQAALRLRFLRSLGIQGLQQALADPKQHPRLAERIVGLTKIYCEDVGALGVPAAVAILRDPQAGQQEKIGAIRVLRSMVVDPIAYSYSRNPSDTQTPEIVEVWKTWWQQAEAADRQRVAEGKPPEYPPLPPERSEALASRFAAMLSAPTRMAAFEQMQFFDRQRFEPYRPADMRFFVERLLGNSSLAEKNAAAAVLGGTIGQPLAMDVPLDAKPELVQEVSSNWLLHFDFSRTRYEPSAWKKVWDIVADTQYAYMAWRLVTFNFGRSAVRTREPVGAKIWNAVLVSAPLMIVSEILIYLVAVPLGIVCAVHRGRWPDRLISLKLFLLYSIPPFVAGMLFLMFFCYGDYLQWFPMDGLHSDWADDLGPLGYAVDYLWHITLPVVCLSLFSLAAMAMYSRTSMLDVIGQDYIRTARAKGVPERLVVYKHALRNALIPIITLFATFLPAMLGGSVLIEVLFGIPGMGWLSWESIEQKDFPTLMALIWLDALVVMVSILLTDLLYVLVDPRISLEGQGQAA